MKAAILQPAVALMAWTMVMWLWMYATRLPAMTAAGLDPDALLAEALKTQKASQAAAEVAKLTGLDRKTLYARALELK